MPTSEAVGLVYVLGLGVGILATAGFGVLLARTGALPGWIGWCGDRGALAFLFRANEGGRAIDAIAWTVVGVGLLVGALRVAHRNQAGLVAVTRSNASEPLSGVGHVGVQFVLTTQ